MIQNQAGAGLAPLGNFCNIYVISIHPTLFLGLFLELEIVSAEGSEVFGHQVLLCKMPKGARPAPVGFSNLMVSATQNH